MLLKKVSDLSLCLLYIASKSHNKQFCLQQISIKEEDRLSSVIADIDEDVKIVPRAAFVQTPTGEVIANRSFEGTINSLSNTVNNNSLVSEI